MGLAEDIKQKEFRSDYQKALINIMYTYNHIIGEMNMGFKAMNITKQQYNVLRILKGQHPKPASINIIKERMLDKMSDASRIVQRLLNKGLISRSKSRIDGRAVEVTISDKGLRLLEQSHEQVKDFDKLIGNLSPEEAQTLNKLLDKIRQ